MPTPRNWPFIATKEHRRFVEFADVVKREQTIGICYGPAGIGKTLSATHYARWDTAEPLLRTWGPRAESDHDVYAALDDARTVLYTPIVAAPVRQLRDDLKLRHSRVNICIDQHDHSRRDSRIGDNVELVVIDESERLSATAIELLRDQYDRGHHGLLFIGMPGIEKTFSRYPQLYSRVGFAHHYRPLTGEELTFVLTRHWHKLGLELDADDFTDAQAVEINELHTITADVVETARSTLVIGAT
ncbi:AAA family ATPase [Nocardia sp. NPDC059239]|uniref:AAA family ATPase n=1 Tax=unclassified Nocardia TaxID=2637762 RepID=UPI0036A092A2